MPKVMIIDDSPLVTRMVSLFLERFGFDVVVVNSPFGVSNRIRETAPDVLLVDLGLPGLSGQGLISLIKGNDSAKIPPIILISADEAQMKEMVAGGKANAYFVKGQPLEELEKKIRGLLFQTSMGGVGQKTDWSVTGDHV